MDRRIFERFGSLSDCFATVDLWLSLSMIYGRARPRGDLSTDMWAPRS
jgi:hypothetical protein